MAAPTYATDLVRIFDFDNDTPTVSEPTGWTAGRQPTNVDTDFPIQSTTHGSLTMNTTGKAGMVGAGSTRTWTSGDYLFGWIIWLAPGAIAIQTSGGLAMIAGSSSSVQKIFYVGGSDWGAYPYGGWQNFAVDPELTADETNGTATDFYVVGGGANVSSAVSKGNPLGIDVFRYGRGEFRVYDGDGTTPATFAGMATANDASAARWGLFQEIVGGYKFKGLMVLGYSAACTFEDENKNIAIDDMIYVNSDFNGVEIRNASSDISWTNIKFNSLNSTSPGTFEVVDNATVLLETCGFTDMDTFIFLSNTECFNTTFRNCGQITAGGADLTGSIITGYEGTSNTSALIWNVATDPDGLIDSMSFTKGTATTHAIEFGTSSPTTMTIRDCAFGTVYSSTEGGTTGDETFHFKRTSGSVTLNVVGCTGNFGYRTDGASVTIVADPVTTTITVKDINTLGLVTGAQVYLAAANATGPLHYQASVTISGSGTVATVTHTAHGLATDDLVLIKGCTNSEEPNGVKTITVTGANAYTYASTSSTITGTMTSTDVIFNEATTGTGIVTDSRTLASDQPVVGRVRKTSASTFYKSSPISETIDNTGGLSVTVLLIPDE